MQNGKSFADFVRTMAPVLEQLEHNKLDLGESRPRAASHRIGELPLANIPSAKVDCGSGVYASTLPTQRIAS